MPTPLHGLRPPYELASNIVYFHDWRYVQHGYFKWLDETGEGRPLFTTETVPPLHLEQDRNMPSGIRLAAQRAQKSEPVLAAAEDEILLMGGSLIRENGRFRLWYESWPKADFGSPHAGNDNTLKYAESDDGMAWRLRGPCYSAAETRGHGYHGGCIFKDPSAPASERYKAFHLGHLTPAEYEAFRAARPDAVDPFTSPKRPHGIFGAVSPDGLHWQHIATPLVIQNSDTHNVCEWDALTGRYVGYCRSFYFNRRTIGRMATEDFRRFPLPEELVWPSPSMAPHDLWYANGKTRMPGAPDYHVMFPLLWNLPRDRFEFHLMTSPDGIVWSAVPGGPVCEPGGPGAWDAGVVWPGIGLTDLPGGRMGILYEGSPLPHKHPRQAPLGKLAWAWWPQGRLVALEAPGDGAFALWPLRVTGRAARLNFRTHAAGSMAVESVGPDGKALPGRSFDDCDRLAGDRLEQRVTWKGQADLGHSEGAPVILRFRLRAAELFSVHFE